MFRLNQVMNNVNRYRNFLQYIIISCLMLLAVSETAGAQSIDDLLRFYERGDIDRVRSGLLDAENHNNEHPGFIFLQAVVEEDAEVAYALYSRIQESAPDHPVFELALLKMIQYNFAKGLYRQTTEQSRMFVSKFPESDHLSKIQEMISSVSSKVSAPINTIETNIEESNRKIFTIQVAAFGSMEGARRGLQYYQKLGLSDAVIREHKVGNQLLYKIWVGEYPDSESARREADDLIKRYRLSSYRIIEKNQ